MSADIKGPWVKHHHGPDDPWIRDQEGRALFSVGSNTSDPDALRALLVEEHNAVRELSLLWEQLHQGEDVLECLAVSNGAPLDLLLAAVRKLILTQKEPRTGL